MKCLFIFNEMSGKRKSKTFFSDIIDKLKQKFEEVCLFPTTGVQSDTIEQATSACGKFDTIVVSGGDGTFSDVVQGVAGKSNRPVLGYIPSGSCNDFAKSNNIPNKVNKALDIILNGFKLTKSALCMGKSYASYICSGGLFTNLSYTTESKKKKLLGKFAYYIDALIRPKENKTISLTTNIDGTIKTDTYSLFGFFHSKRVSGFKVSSKLIEDDKVDCILVKAHPKKSLNIISTVLCLARVVFFGASRTRNSKYLTYTRAEKVSVKVNDSFNWNIDGEKGFEGDIEIVLLPKQYEVMVANI